MKVGEVTYLLVGISAMLLSQIVFFLPLLLYAMRGHEELTAKVILIFFILCAVADVFAITIAMAAGVGKEETAEKGDAEN